MAAGILQAFVALGQCLGPLYGAFAFERIGFRYTCDILAVTSIVFSIVYFIVGDGLGAIKSKASKMTDSY